MIDYRNILNVERSIVSTAKQLTFELLVNTDIDHETVDF